MLTKKDSLKNEVKTSKASKASDTQAKASPSANAQKAVPSHAVTKTTSSSNGTKAASNKTTSKMPVATEQKPAPALQTERYKPLSTDKKGPKTRVTIKYDVGFNNYLTIRGSGAGLNWNKGMPLRNIKADEWSWETDESFSTCEFKVLINDQNYETGQNHILNSGSTIVYTPHFPR